MKKLLLILVPFSLVLSGCVQGQPVPVKSSQTSLPANLTLPKESAAVTRTPRPTATPVPTIVLTPTPTFTATADPKVYNPGNFGDSRQLDSFVMKVSSVASGSGAGQLASYSDEYEYNRSPLSIHDKSQNGNGPFEFWVIDNWMYGFSDHWSAMPFQVKKDPTGGSAFADLDMRVTSYLVKFISAKFVGQETYQDLPVYHFSFDTSDMVPSKAAWKVDTAQGDVLVSVNGNIPLYYEVTVTGNILTNANGADYLPGKIIFTKALSQINQPVKFALPASYPNLAVEPGFPLPLGTGLDHLDLYDKVSQYFYFTQVSKEDFLSFYQNLAPTNGWTVEKIGPLEGNSYNCEACVILSHGKENVRIVWNQDFHQTFIMVFNPPELY